MWVPYYQLMWGVATNTLEFGITDRNDQQRVVYLVRGLILK